MTECVNISSVENGSNDAAAGVTLMSVINQVFLPAVCIFGVVGNLLNLAILTRRKLQKSFRTLEQAANLCLVALALSDLMFCISAFLTVFLPSDNIYDTSGFWLFYGKYNVAIINIFIMESTLLTVAMSLERYLAICFPLRQDIYLTTSRIKFVIFFTFLFSVAFNIPVFWRNESVIICAGISGNPTWSQNRSLIDVTSVGEDFPQTTYSSLDFDIDVTPPNVAHIVYDVSNVSSNLRTITQPNGQVLSSILSSASSSLTQPKTVCRTQSSPISSHLTTHSVTSKFSLAENGVLATENRTLHTVKIVLLYGSHVYDTTYRIVWAVVGNFLPLILLFYFNVCLCRQIYNSYKLRKLLGRQKRARSSSNVLTITLVAIVVLFFILVAPSEVTLQVSHVTSSGDTPLYKNIEAVLNLMQSINFSVNFILYCTISPHFRRTLKYMILCGWCQFHHRTRDFTVKFKTSTM